MTEPLENSFRTSTRREKLSDQIYAYVFANIVEGIYSEGTKLPTEEGLSRQFGISRPIVREALARLRDDGLIYSRQGAGSYVQCRPFDADSSFGHLGSIADLEQCYEFRAEVESAAAALAAERANQGAIDIIRSALTEMEDVTANRGIGIETDFEFHKAIVEASGNRFFVTTILTLQKQMKFGMLLGRQFSLIRPTDRLARVTKEHSDVFDAIQQKEPKKARAAMQAHLQNAWRRTFKGEL